MNKTRKHHKQKVKVQERSTAMAEAQKRLDKIMRHYKAVSSDRRAFDLLLDASQGIAQTLSQIQSPDFEEG